MIVRVAVRSLATRPLRTAVLAAGFGLAIAVMAELLGVGEVILEQAHSPALRGGGDLVVTGVLGELANSRFVLSNVVNATRSDARAAVASPSRRTTLYLIKPGMAMPIAVRGGIPSLERGVGDPEIAQAPEWVDGPGDAAWVSPNQGDVLRAMDRFHPVPSVAPGFPGSPKPRSAEGGPGAPKPPGGEGGSRTSWAEWLYFNGRSPDGRLRFYLTFLTDAPDAAGKRRALVRLQLHRDGRSTNYSAVDVIDDGALLQQAPDLDVAGNRVRLEGLRYHLTLALDREGESSQRVPAPLGPGAAGRQRRPGPFGPDAGLRGHITLDAVAGRSLPPSAIQGARGWVSGYVAPVLSGAVGGSLTIDGATVPLDGVVGYHDHNWGFWEGVRWQWGQVAHGDLSIVYGRVFPPSSVADPASVPGFLGILGPDGPIAFSTNVTIDEHGDGGIPRSLDVVARGNQLDLHLAFSMEESVRTQMSLTQSATGPAMDFLQLGGHYTVNGRGGGRELSFTAPGSAETFRQSR